MKCMFDTNVFNDILDGKILLGDIRSDVICYVTHIQRDEINKTKDDSCYVPLYMSHFVSTYLRWDKQKNPTLLRG